MIERTVSVETSNKPTLKPLLSDLNAQNLNKKDSWKNSNNSAEKQTKNRQKPKKANIKYLDLAVKNTEKKAGLYGINLVEKQNNATLIQTADKVSENESEAGLKNTILAENLLPNLAYHKFIPNFFIEVQAPTLPKIEPKPAEHFKKGLSIRLAYSPDISTVGNNEITKIGSNWGALLEYRLSKHLIVQSGIIKSIKYYDVYPEQYDWVWGNPASKLMEINAVCNMLDIPLNIRYDIIANNKSRIFVSTGLTSYLMMKEKYHYDYEDNANTNIKRRDWSGKTGMYKSSNLNLSVGFEKQVARSLTLQIEPFAKSPLKNIGFGKVPLITYGLMFSADYQLKNLFKK